MKTYTKLPIEQVEVTNEDGTISYVDWPQMYEVVDTTTTITKDKTYRENFVSVIAWLQEKKAKLIEEIDAEILENQLTLNAIDAL